MTDRINVTRVAQPPLSLRTSAPREKFWSDNFDMDLLKLWPDLPQQLGKTGERVLWTVGHMSDGRLNHPSVWNSHGAFVWLSKPNLARDKHGWFSVHGCTGDSPQIECTWLELLRDQWPHGYSFIMLPKMEIFRCHSPREFGQIMYHVRGWRPDPEIQYTMGRCFNHLIALTRQLEDVLNA